LLPPAHCPPSTFHATSHRTHQHLEYRTITPSHTMPPQDAPLGSQIAEDGSPIDLQIRRGGVFKFSDPAVRARPGLAPPVQSV
jgi:hypothetical protein